MKRVGFGFLAIVIVLTCLALFLGVSDSVPQGMKVAYFIFYLLFWVYILFLYPKKIQKRMQSIHKEIQGTAFCLNADLFFAESYVIDVDKGELKGLFLRNPFKVQTLRLKETFDVEIITKLSGGNVIASVKCRLHMPGGDHDIWIYKAAGFTPSLRLDTEEGQRVIQFAEQTKEILLLANSSQPSIKDETAVIGIDLGTTHSLVALWKEGQVELIPNSLGHIMTPSVVGVDDDGSILVGEIARQRRISHPDFTAAEFKRNMGTDTKYVLGKKKYLPEELSAILLKKLVEDAKNRTGARITEAVISVPAYFDNNQREATKRAARLAGLEVKRLINEPSAAILYHRWKAGRMGTEGLYLVIDFGGGTLDVSVVDCFENIIEMIAVAGNNQLGGKDFDRAIAEDFCRKNGLEFELLRKSVRENLLWTAEGVKRALTDKESVTMRVVIEEKEYVAEYDTGELLKVSAEILVKMKAVLNEALQGAKVNKEAITDVILVGGSCKMPAVQRYLSAFFHRKVAVNEEGDFMVAYGTGVLTGIVGRKSDISDIVMTDVCPFSLGTGAQRYIGKGKYALCMNVLIPKNSILPISKAKVFCGTSPNQKKMWIDILQGEEEYALGNLFLGEVQINVTPDSEGRTEAEVTFCYDINGVLEVKVRDVYGNHTAETVVVSRHSGLSPEEIEKKRIDINSEQRFERNKEENRSVIAWGQRLYAQANNEQKRILADIIADFESAVESNDMIMVRRKRPKLLKQLAELEQLINRDYFDNRDIIAQLLEDEQ